MIVSCPACSARYRFDPSKIKGRGAKITCPRCGHKFVVYKDGTTPKSTPSRSSSDKTPSTRTSTRRDFRRVGVTWRVRTAEGVTYNVHDLQTLLDHLSAGRVSRSDALSYDARTWVPIDAVGDLGSYFDDIWRRAERGAIPEPPTSTPMPPRRSFDDEEEGPTTIMGHGSAVMDDIRRAVAEATTPPPTGPRRDANPTPPTRVTQRPGGDPPSGQGPRRERSPTAPTPHRHVPRAATPEPPPRGATPRPAPPRPGQPTEDPSLQRDNMILIGVSIVAALLILGVLAWLLLQSGAVKFGGGASDPTGHRVPVDPAVPTVLADTTTASEGARIRAFPQELRS